VLFLQLFWALARAISSLPWVPRQRAHRPERHEVTLAFTTRAHLRFAEALCRQGRLQEAVGQLARSLGDAAGAAGGDAPSSELKRLQEAHARILQVQEGLTAAEAALAGGSMAHAQAILDELSQLNMHSPRLDLRHVIMLTQARLHLATGASERALGLTTQVLKAAGQQVASRALESLYRKSTDHVTSARIIANHRR